MSGMGVGKLLNLETSSWLEDLACPMPEGECLFVPMDDGVRLRLGLFEPGKPDSAVKGTLVLMTGYSEFIEKYAETIGDFLALDYRVTILEWRGHGLSGGRLPNQPKVLHLDDFETNISDLVTAMQSVIMQVFPRPYFGVAHSMGGQILLRTAVKHPDFFSMLSLCAPLLGAIDSGFNLWRLKLVARFLQWRDKLQTPLPSKVTDRVGGEMRVNRVTNDQARFQRTEEILINNPHANVEVKSIGWSVAALKTMEDTLRPEFLGGFETPIFIGLADEELLVDNSASHKATAYLPQAVSRVYPDTKHELFMEKDGPRRKFISDIDSFFMTGKITAP